jgi:murein DD-endopeptidase MepM/ murein hydrolase activator NlpD
VLTVAIVTGVGAASVSLASVSLASASSPAATPAPTPTPVAIHAEIIPAPPASVRALRVPAFVPFARVLRKTKPVPPVATVVGWVNPLPQAVVTSCFGMRWGHLHAGVDLAAPNGTPIRAAGAGIVLTEGLDAGYGNAVLIDHGDGFLTHYGHMSAITVTDGQRVVAGQQIGDEGSTGHSTGPHLHFEVRQGPDRIPIEPTEWMHQHGVTIRGCVTP